MRLVDLLANMKRIQELETMRAQANLAEQFGLVMEVLNGGQPVPLFTLEHQKELNTLYDINIRVIEPDEL
jgi:hypothetical protein